jgi:hypothetical protein
MAGDGAQAPAKETAELISSTVANRYGHPPYALLRAIEARDVSTESGM